MNEILQAISTYGFPIVACLIMGWYVKFQDDRHHAEIKEITEAINNNTLALTKLSEKLEDK